MRLLQWLLIPALCIAAAVGYGVLHDLVTAHVCVEYFSEFHPAVWGHTRNPWLLAVTWGVIATWWAGFLVSVFVTPAARIGSEPRWGARQLLRPLGVLLGAMAACALIAGAAGYVFSEAIADLFAPRVLSVVEPHRRARFAAVLAAHNANYLAGFGGAMVLAVWIVIQRRRATVAA